MKGKIGIVIALSVLMLTPVVLAYGSDSGSSGGQPISNPWKQCMNNAEKAHMFGMFTYDSAIGAVTGRFVDFTISQDGKISNYAVERSNSSITIFSSVYLENFTPSGTPKVNGAMFQYVGDEAMITAHNNPAAVLHFTVQNTGNTVVYVLASGFTATKLPKSYNVKISGNGITGYIINGNSSISIDNNTVTVTLNSASQSLFRVIPVDGPVGQRNQDKIMEKIEEGKVIGEVSVSAYGGEKSSDMMQYQRQVQMQIQNAQKNMLQIKVSAQYQEGKCVIINVDKETMNASANQHIVVKMDGQKMEKADIDTVLNAHDSKGRYNVTEGSNGYQICVYIPHFSDHTLTVETESTSNEESQQTPGFTAGALVIGSIGALGIMAILRKRRT